MIQFIEDEDYKERVINQPKLIENAFKLISV